MKPEIYIKRVYEKPLRKDGLRILVDRLWPRGLRKEEAKFDEWVKILAPSVSLRKWFGHDPELWIEFEKKYMRELRHNKLIDTFIDQHADKKRLTLLYAAKDASCNHAIILKKYLDEQFSLLKER